MLDISRGVSQTILLISTDLLLKLGIFGLILIAAWIITRLLGILVSKAAGKANPNVARQARRFLTYIIWLVGFLVGLGQLGLDLTLLLAIATLTGVAIAISLRSILSDVASHEVITTYALFKIGDWIEVEGFFGRVVDITLMDTVLVTLDNEKVYMPNSKITKSVVVNKTTPEGIRISVPLTVDKTSDLSAVEKALLEIGAELSEDLVIDSKPEVRVTCINSHSVKLALLLKINNPAKSRLIASEVRKRAKNRMDQIEKKAVI
jgi:small conductance mechanosensitive channel